MAVLKPTEQQPIPAPVPPSAYQPAPEYTFSADQIGVAGTETQRPVFPKLAVNGRPYDLIECTQHYFNGGRYFVIVPGGIPFRLSDYEVKPASTDAPPQD